MKKIWERNSVMILSDMFGYTLALQDLQNVYSAIHLGEGNWRELREWPRADTGYHAW